MVVLISKECSVIVLVNESVHLMTYVHKTMRLAFYRRFAVPSTLYHQPECDEINTCG
jgi:hypothetical protein